MSTPAEVRKFKLPLTPIECAGCQMCSFQRGHAIAYKDANGEMVGYFDLVAMVEQADVRIAELEAENAKLVQLIYDIKADYIRRYDLSLEQSIRARIQKITGDE